MATTINFIATGAWQLAAQLGKVKASSEERRPESAITAAASTAPNAAMSGHPFVDGGGGAWVFDATLADTSEHCWLRAPAGTKIRLSGTNLETMAGTETY